MLTTTKINIDFFITNKSVKADIMITHHNIKYEYLNNEIYNIANYYDPTKSNLYVYKKANFLFDLISNEINKLN